MAIGTLPMVAAAATAANPGKHLRKHSANRMHNDQTFDSRRLTTGGERREESFTAITEITVVYDEEPCPPEYTMVQQDLNAGTNGKAVHMCYKRRDSTASNEEVVTEITLLSGSVSDEPSCPEGFDPVQNAGSSDTSTADLNHGAKGSFLWWETTKVITMCYRKGANTCDCSSGCECSGIYQLRSTGSVFGLPPVMSRWFERLDQNLNEGVGGNFLYLAYSHSPSFVAGAVALVEGDRPIETAVWSTAQESPTGDIAVQLTIDCQLNGGGLFDSACLGASPMEDTEFERLCQLAREGIEQYWSGPVTVLGVTRNVVVTTVEMENGIKKDIDICMCGEEYGDGNSCFFGLENTHHNSDWDILDMTLWYGKNWLPSQWYADEVFKRVAAHEIGHSFLYDYGGLVYSWGHKNTSSANPFDSFPDGDPLTPPCPEIGETVDLMKYYIGDCWLGFDWETFNENYGAEIDKWDRASMLMTVGEYDYSSPD